MKKLIYLLLVLPFFISCSSDDKNDTISSIKINEKDIIVNVGETFKFSISIYPSSVKYSSFNWISSDTKIAKIDTTGILEALSDGNITVKAYPKYYPYITDEVSVSISPIMAESISIDSIANIYYDDSKCFNIKYYPEKAKHQEIIWTSSNDKIATVSSYGCVKINGIGNATLTATLSGTNISSSCKVSINHRNPNRNSVQCIAKTQAGSRCKRMTTNLNARCWQHQ